MGHPLWIGMRRRVAKKWLNRRPGDMHARLRAMRDLANGDLVTDCTGMNGRLLRIEPVYWRVGRRGRVLMDFELTTTNTMCSMYHCGVAPARSYEQLVAYRDQVLRRFAAHDPGDLLLRYGPEVMTIDRDGTVTIDHARLEALRAAKRAAPGDASPRPPGSPRR